MTLQLLDATRLQFVQDGSLEVLLLQEVVIVSRLETEELLELLSPLLESVASSFHYLLVLDESHDPLKYKCCQASRDKQVLLQSWQVDLRLSPSTLQRVYQWHHGLCVELPPLSSSQMQKIYFSKFISSNFTKQFGICLL